jgi:hypothetical protein
MSVTDWISNAIALAALAASGVTAVLTWRWRISDRGSAEMTVYFHRNSEMAKVHTEGQVRLVGYNLVLWNRGPCAATKISFEVFNGTGAQMSLVDLDAHELPLSRLESGARYPVPWLLGSEEHGRHFRCSLYWEDGNGSHSITLPLRRGETSQ